MRREGICRHLMGRNKGRDNSMTCYVVRVQKYFYATETYIMHFLEAAQFLNAPDLARRKVIVLYAPLKCLGPETTTLFSFA